MDGKICSSPNQSPKDAIISEGRVEFVAGISNDQIFYNPIQEFNRDLTYVLTKLSTLNFVKISL